MQLRLILKAINRNLDILENINAVKSKMGVQTFYYEYFVMENGGRLLLLKKRQYEACSQEDGFIGFLRRNRLCLRSNAGRSIEL